ncbi:caspase-8-like [Haliotis rubra]|uniref:caspase-8-like n=1 Tax=Haliotis rubra TaxID=36100 RepID=UPI001EE62ABA|nr:caspase-8-like [Haliotis rubra]XP_046547080.1 caspase-8-like [Haliotis rubra]
MADTDVDRYRMKSKPRGICLIIDNINEVPNRAPHKHKLSETFRKLHFDVQFHNQLNDAQFTRVIRRVASVDHETFDCVVVFITAHGDDDVVFTVDDRSFCIDELASHFKPENCPSLAGKPKLFFIEACRGEDKQHALKLVDTVDASGATRFPNEADFFFGYSTVKSFVTYNGWYRKLVADTFDQKAERDHLLDMMTEVNRKMSELEHLDDDGSLTIQTSEMTSRLRRKVFFNPET